MQTIKRVVSSETINDAKLLELDTFSDDRGEIWTLHDPSFLDGKRFVADKVTISKLGVLRGFHGDPVTAKLIACLGGALQLSILDLRKDSQTYGHSDIFFLSDDKPAVVYVPAGVVNAHLSLSERCIFYYKWSEDYAGPDNQVTIAWNDPAIGVKWNVPEPILSERDHNGVPFMGVFL